MTNSFRKNEIYYFEKTIFFSKQFNSIFFDKVVFADFIYINTICSFASSLLHLTVSDAFSLI